MEKRVNDIQFSFKNNLNEKVAVLQQQIDEASSKTSNDFFTTNEKIELAIAEFGDKLREVQTKTLWQINDSKAKLATCVNEQFVRDANKELEGKILTKLKEQSIKQGAVDPARIQKIEQNIVKNEKLMMNQMTETNFKIESIKEHIEASLLSKKQNGEYKVQIEKRFGILNSNMNDMVRRVKSSEDEIISGKKRHMLSEQYQVQSEKQVYSVIFRLKG